MVKIVSCVDTTTKKGNWQSFCGRNEKESCHNFCINGGSRCHHGIDKSFSRWRKILVMLITSS